MSQQPNPQPSQPSQISGSQPVQMQTSVGKRTEKFLMDIWEPLDALGKSLMGDYWKTVYLSVQDAIAREYSDTKKLLLASESEQIQQMKECLALLD